jgi:hypothetical protein
MAESSTLKQTLTSSDKALLAFFEQSWLLHGSLPTREVCVKAGFGGSLFDKALKNESFKDALQRRGITLGSTSLLTPEQLSVANIMLDIRDNRSQRKKLQECNVTTAKWEGWLRDPAFQQYIRSRAEAMLGDNLHESHLALLDRVRSGDISAIKYFNEITGRYVPSGNEKVDVNGVLMKVLEIIQRHVKEPEALNNIAADFLLLADTSGVQARMPGVSRPIVMLETINDTPVGFGEL